MRCSVLEASSLLNVIDSHKRCSSDLCSFLSLKKRDERSAWRPSSVSQKRHATSRLKPAPPPFLGNHSCVPEILKATSVHSQVGIAITIKIGQQFPGNLYRFVTPLIRMVRLKLAFHRAV